MGFISVFPGFKNPCCCEAFGAYCTPPSCASCISSGGALMPNGNSSVGIPDGLDCYIECGAISYYTHQCMDIAAGQWTTNAHIVSSKSGTLYTCGGSGGLSTGVSCTGSQYSNVLVTVPNFSPGSNGCSLGGSTYVLINPAYNGAGIFPFFGGTSFIIPGSLAESDRGGLSPCAKTITDINTPGFLYEFGTSCRWEWGGADYNFYDQTDGNKMKRCLTGTGCGDCEVKQAPGFFGGGNLAAWYSYFIIVFYASTKPINSPSTMQEYPEVSISVGNMMLPSYNGYTGSTSLICRPLGMAYQPAWRPTPSGSFSSFPSGKYMNCDGPTTFYRVYTPNVYTPPGMESSNWGFPDSVEVEVG